MWSKKILLPLFALLFFTACDPARKGAATSGDDGKIEITFLQLNDVYEISPLSDGSGGLARVAALRKELLAKNPNTYTVLSGDFISPSVIGTLKYENKRIRGRQMVETLNALGLDYVVFGNHEFDYDYEDLQARLDESKFVWMGANARYQQANTDGMVPFFKMVNGQRSSCPDEVTLDVKDADGTQIRLGMFGVLINTGRKPWVVYSDWFEAAKNSREKLRPKTDVCVALTHLNIADDLQLAKMLPDVPLMMGGHDHDNQIHRVGKVTVAKADANAKTVYIHTLRYDKKTRQATVQSVLKKIDASLGEEPATAAVVAKWEKIKNDALSSSGFNPSAVVTTLTTPLDCRETLIRREQAPVGELICQAMLAASKNTPECGVFNSGSVRVDDVLTGTITEIDVVRMLPFGGGFSEVDMRGSLLRRTLETGKTNVGNGGYLQYFRIRQDMTGNWYVNNQPLDDKKIYRVVMPDFLLTGNEQNMSFLKTEKTDAKGATNNPDIVSVQSADPKNKSDLRNDIRLALIQYWRSR